jgi:hypothetical protein
LAGCRSKSGATPQSFLSPSKNPIDRLLRFDEPTRAARAGSPSCAAAMTISVPSTNLGRAPDLVWHRSLTLHTSFGHEHQPAMPVRRRRCLDRANGLCRRRHGGCPMGSLGPTHLFSLLLVVAIIAATYRLFALPVARRNRRRARGFFLVGFFCGFMSCAILRRRHRRLQPLGAAGRCAQAFPPGIGLFCGTCRFAARVLTFAAPSVRRKWWSRLPRGCGPSLAARTSVVNALIQRVGVGMPNSLARLRR